MPKRKITTAEALDDFMKESEVGREVIAWAFVLCQFGRSDKRDKGLCDRLEYILSKTKQREIETDGGDEHDRIT